MNNDRSLEKKIKGQLEYLNRITQRDIEKAKTGKTAFMTKATEEKNRWSREQAGKGSYRIKNIFRKKETKSMWVKAAGVIAIVALLLSSAGVGTVYASQDSLPGESLYPVKTWSEDFRLDLVKDDIKALDLNLNFAERRVEEIITLIDAGTVPQDEVFTRLDDHLQRAEDIANSSDEPAAAFDKVTEKLSVQLQNATRLQDATGDQTMLKTQQMLQTHLQTAEQKQTQEKVQMQEPEKLQDGALNQNGEGPKMDDSDTGALGPVPENQSGNDNSGEQNQQPGNSESHGQNQDPGNGSQSDQSGQMNDQKEGDGNQSEKSGNGGDQQKTRTPMPKGNGNRK